MSSYNIAFSMSILVSIRSTATLHDLSMKFTCDDAVSINCSITLIIGYFSNRLIVAALQY